MGGGDKRGGQQRRSSAPGTPRCTRATTSTGSPAGARVQSGRAALLAAAIGLCAPN